MATGKLISFGIILTLFVPLVASCGGGVSKAFAPTEEGADFVRKENYESAIERFNLAISLDPEFSPAFINRGHVFDHLREYERAIEDFDEAIRLDPENAVAYNNRAFTQRNSRRFKLALADFDEAIRLNPVYDHAYAGRFLVHSALGNVAEAEKDFDQAVIFGYDADELRKDLERASREVIPTSP